ncbi:MAG: phosphate ABC transporter permease PstA [Haloferacaceae archaeon]
MTTAEPTDAEFESVSRVRGVAFRYLALGASLVGIVTLAVLLGYVAVDAFGLRAAAPAWFLAFFLALVAPTGAFLAYAFRRPTVWDTALGTTVRLLGGTALATAVVVLFVVADVQLWFLVFTLGVVPPVLAVAYGRYAEDPRLGFPVPHLLFLGGTLAAVVVKGPLGVYPTDAIIYAWTLAVPAAAYVGGRWFRRAGRRAGAAAGVAALAVAVGGGIGIAAVVGVRPAVGIVLGVVPLVVTLSYAAETVRDRPLGRRGLLFPVVVVGGTLVGQVAVTTLGVAGPEPWLDWAFLTNAPSRFPEEAGLYPAIIGSVFIISLVAAFSFVVGVASAIYLEEYAPESGVGGAVTRLIQVNISNLAGVPSVVYGLLGLGVFVNLLGLGFGVVLVAALTLSLLILPIVVIAAQEALRSVPDALRQASYGMGATRWQTVRSVVIPEALPGILTGTILALGRAIGETAPLIIIGLATTRFSPPTGLLSKTTAMPTQIFGWAFLPQEAFREGVLAAGVVTLMAVLLTINSVAIYVRNKYERES